MALRFLGIDPGTNGDNCPAVFLEEETGDILFQGWTVTDPQTLADSSRHRAITASPRWSRSRCCATRQAARR
jgi:hypothetical protein